MLNPKHYIPNAEFTFLETKIRVIQLPNRKYISQYKKKGFWKDKWVNLVTYRGSDEAYPYETMTRCVKGIIYHFSEELRCPI